MAANQNHFPMLRALFRPWYIKAGSVLASLAAAVGIYASLQDQFPDKLPKLQDAVLMTHVLILPWWGWLLVLQAVLGFGLYDYVRRTVGAAKLGEGDLAQLAIARVEQHAPRLARLEEADANIDALQTKVTVLAGTVAALVQRQNEHVSTPELGTRLQNDISDLNNRLVARIGAVETQVERIDTTVDKREEGALESAKLQLKMNIELSNGLAEAKKAAETQAQTLSGKTAWLEKDVRDILLFAADLATLEVLEGFAAEGEALKIPLGSDVDPDHRVDCLGQVQTLISRIRTTFANTHRGLSLGSVLHYAESEAEQELRAIPAGNLPSHMNLFDYRRFKIAETQRVRLVAFLLHQRDEKKGEIRQQRPRFLELLAARTPA